MSEKKKVLIVNNPLQYGGSDLVAVRLQQNLDKEKFECVYCLLHGDEIGPFEPQVAATGVRIIHVPEKYSGYREGGKFFTELFTKEHFDIVHCHLPFYSGIVMKVAYKSGIKKRISHSHFSQPLILEHSRIKLAASELYRKYMRKIISRYSTEIIGCSRQAGEYLCGKKAFAEKGIVLNNGIDTEKYILNKETRNSARKKLGVENQIVLGHIGQMYYVKNHSFLIDIFFEFQKEHCESVLLLIGDGENRKSLEKKVSDLGISEKVRFLGFVNDVPDMLMAMDCFVFPSIHEGFPLTLIEAQMTKLPCVVSDSVTETAKLNDNVSFVSLNSDTGVWCNEIITLIKKDRALTDNSKVIDDFDIKNTAKKLEQIYLS